ncbi:hypothetical protein [Paraburkholderia sp. GAS334]|uniref:hypothetical protein n=1 Tax=Paraburkholderia sp. GAS334 TaxID=3035131 RepID=UPI003D1B0D50
MTLPASFTLSMSQIAAELGLSLPLSLNHAWVEALANKSGLPVSFSDLLGKTGRFDGNISINVTGFGPFPSGSTLFGATLSQITGGYNGATLLTVEIDFNNGTWPPNYTGNFKLTNNSTGASCVLSQLIPGASNTWRNSSPPQNIIRKGQTDSYNIVPSS